MNRLFFLFLLLPLFAEAQAVKQVKKRSKYMLEQFDVLADNDTMRAGTYRKLMLDSRQVLEEGRYEAGQRVGVWTFYSKGTPELVYDYTTRKVVTNSRTQTVASLVQIQQGDTMAQVYLDMSPLYLASSEQLYAIMAREARFPVHLHQQGLRELSFKVVALVSPAGTAYRVLTSHPDADFKKSARGAMYMAFKGVDWIPVVYQEKPVAATYMFESVLLNTIAVEERPAEIRTEMVGRPR